MKAFFPVLLLACALLGCAKKTPVRPLANTTPNNPSEEAVKTTDSTTGISHYTDTTGTTEKSDSSAAIGSPGSVTDPNMLTYLALGDSYTVGESVPKDQSFPYQLTAQLNLKQKVNPPTVIATTGWTTYNLINGINNSGLTSKTYNFVTLLTGVNDQYWDVSKDTYRAQFITTLAIAIRFAKGDKTRVFVMSIPDYSITPSQNWRTTEELSRIAQEIDQFNIINKEESLKAGVNYLNVTDISRQATADPTLLANDGLHPSGKMYALWVERLAPLVNSKLSK